MREDNIDNGEEAAATNNEILISAITYIPIPLM